MMVELDYDTIAREVFSLLDSMDRLASDGALSNEAIMGMIASINPDELELWEIPPMWKQLARADAAIQTRPAVARVLTALSLKAHSDMWDWFSRNVTYPAQHLQELSLKSRYNTDHPEMPNAWISNLFNRVVTLDLARSDINLQAAEFLEGLDAPNYTCPHNRKPILYHVEEAVRLWLNFQPRPGMALETSKAIASLITTASGAFGNTDFLYLRYFQSRIDTLCASLTDEKISLVKIPWETLGDELMRHPLADPNSDEAIGVTILKDLLWITSGLPRPDPVSEAVANLAEEYKKMVELQGNTGGESFPGIASLLRRA